MLSAIGGFTLLPIVMWWSPIMDLVLAVVQMVLAIVFVISAVAKLLDRQGSARAAAGFGVPVTLAPLSGSVLPLVEIGIVVGLISTVTAKYAAFAAMVMLVLFTAVIAAAVLRGRAMSCHCFGRLDTGPVSWLTAIRSGVLAASAGFVAWQGWDDASVGVTSWTDSAAVAGTVAVVMSLIAVGLAVVVIDSRRETLRLRAAYGLEESVDDQHSDIVGLHIGQHAPPFSASSLTGQLVSLDDLRAAGRHVALLFVSPDCFACRQLVPYIVDWQRNAGDNATVAVISSGGIDENRAKLSDLDGQLVLVQDGREIDDRYAVTATPSGIIVGADGMIASVMAGGGAEIVELMRQTFPTSLTGSNGHLVAARVGEPVPAFQLPDGSGRIVSQTSLLGERLLLVFWNPASRHCQQLLAALQSWERHASRDAPRLVVVSSAIASPNGTAALESTVLLDEATEVGRAIGAPGAPAAVLVDTDGRIASPLAIGGRAVRALLEELQAGVGAAA
jgi:peroxiredoxin